MRILRFAVGIAVIFSAQAQNVSLRNVSFPGTALEPGNWVEVRITGAIPFGTVTVVENGGAPYFFGTTDASGNWSISAQETLANVGDYSQQWLVNGIPMVPTNPNSTYLPYGPRLPNFSVHAPYFTNPCPAQSTINLCGPSTAAQHWIWSPVTFESQIDPSDLGFSNFLSAAFLWNTIQSKLSLSSDISVRQDIQFIDDNISAGVLGETITLGQNCGSPCYNYLNQCTGGCFNAAAVYYVMVRVNFSAIDDQAFYLGLTREAVGRYLITHEFGHALRLNHQPVHHGGCSEVSSVMYQVSGPALSCGVTTPTSCDANGITAVYPSSVPICSTLQSNTCLLIPSNQCL